MLIQTNSTILKVKSTFKYQYIFYFKITKIIGGLNTLKGPD